MSHLRALLRLVLVVAWCGLAFVACVALLLLGTLVPEPAERVHGKVARLWARGSTALLGMAVRVAGRPPRPPFLLVCNHLGYVDIVTIMSQVPAIFVAKSEVAGWPLLGPLARVGRTIFVTRNQLRDVVRVNERVASVLRRGRGVVMFPEGTSSPGKVVLPFRSSLLEPAVRLGHPVTYATLHYRTPEGSPPAEEAICWWGDMSFPGHFWRLLHLPQFEAELIFGAESVRAGDRHELAADLRRAVARQLEPLSAADVRCL